jgi:hypothetical protein
MRRSLLLIAGLSALAFAGADVFVAPARAEQETAGWGNPQAKLRIVEMVDYQCPYCQIVHQRLMEATQFDPAAAEKHRLEEKQRAVRKEREKAGIEYKCKYFEQVLDPISGQMMYKYNGRYWDKRKNMDYADMPDLY